MSKLHGVKVAYSIKSKIILAFNLISPQMRHIDVPLDIPDIMACQVGIKVILNHNTF